MRALENLGCNQQVVEQGCVTAMAVAFHLAHGPLIMELPTPSPKVGFLCGEAVADIFRPTLARSLCLLRHLESGCPMSAWAALIQTSTE